MILEKVGQNIDLWRFSGSRRSHDAPLVGPGQRKMFSGRNREGRFSFVRNVPSIQILTGGGPSAHDGLWFRETFQGLPPKAVSSERPHPSLPANWLEGVSLYQTTADSPSARWRRIVGESRSLSTRICHQEIEVFHPSHHLTNELKLR